MLKQLIKLDSLIVDAKSGVSGSGKKLTENSHYPVINENALLYKINSHQHVPEILQQLKKFDSGIESLQFSTTLIPITRGIMATIYAKPKDADGFNLEALKKHMRKFITAKMRQGLGRRIPADQGRAIFKLLRHRCCLR